MRASIFLILMVFSSNLFGQSYWKKLSFKSNQEDTQRASSFFEYELDLKSIRNELAETPIENFKSNQKGKTIYLPTADGSLKAFEIVESSIMMPGLQAKFPNIRSYKGKSSDETMITRIDINNQGLSATIKAPLGTMYIDHQKEKHIVYRLKDTHFKSKTGQWGCATEDIIPDENHRKKQTIKNTKDINTPLAPVKLHTYRLAIACTGHWAQANGGTKESAMAAMNTIMNRANLTYETDLAIRLLFVDNNDELIYLDADTDPYDEDTGIRAMRDMNTQAISDVIGYDAFDFGHLLTGPLEGGILGIGFFDAICTENKGAGVSSDEDGDRTFMAFLIAHEMGHCMGSWHVFSNCSGNVGSRAYAYEIGSGSSIMSYAGICGSQNIINNSYDHYHVSSLTQILTFMKEGVGASCANIIETDNTTPRSIPDQHEYNIPKSTPFVLNGIAEDMEDSLLTYKWEQHDLGPFFYLGEDVNEGPAFRNYDVTDTGERVVPRISNLLSNPFGTDKEYLSQRGRDYSFNLVVRDNHASIGGVHWDEIDIHAIEEIGPFNVVFPNEFIRLDGGMTIDIEWDVNDTDKAPVNCKAVKISVSYDGGRTYPEVIADSTANDGKFTWQVPNVRNFRGRIKIEPVDNIFFDISNSNFVVFPVTTPVVYLHAEAPSIHCLDSDELEVVVKSNSLNNYEDSLEISIANLLPNGVRLKDSIAFMGPDDEVSFYLELDENVVAGSYPIDVIGIPNSSDDTVFTSFNLVLRDDSFSPLEITVGNQSDIVNTRPDIQWSKIAEASSYMIRVSDSPSFDSIIEEESDLEFPIYTLKNKLEDGKVYFYQITAINSCGSYTYPTELIYVTPRVCKTYALDQPIDLYSESTSFIRDTLIVEDDFEIIDVNISKLSGFRVGGFYEYSMKKVGRSFFSLTPPLVLNFEGGLDIAYDDQAVDDYQYDLNSGREVQPYNPLSIYNGRRSQGEWVLQANNFQEGVEGQITDFDLELCGLDSSVIDPLLVRNEILEMAPFIQRTVSNTLLYVEHPLMPSRNIDFTILELPIYGELLLDGEVMSIGSVCTQSDIDMSKLTYRNEEESDIDSFRFFAEDGLGGVLSPQVFHIAMDDGFPTSVEEIDPLETIKVFPTLTSSFVTIQLKNISNVQVEMISSIGQLVWTRTIHSDTDIDVSSLQSGNYLLKISTANGQFVSKKLVIQH